MHVREDIPNATVFFQHPKKKPLLPCRTRDGISQQAWCPSYVRQGPFAAAAIVKSRAKYPGPPCSAGTSGIRPLVVSATSLVASLAPQAGVAFLIWFAAKFLYAKVTSFDILQVGHDSCGSAALQTHSQGTEIQHLPGYTGVRTVNNPILSGSPLQFISTCQQKAPSSVTACRHQELTRFLCQFP